MQVDSHLQQIWHLPQIEQGFGLSELQPGQLHVQHVSHLLQVGHNVSVSVLQLKQVSMRR
ncbi:MAG: hypothetical protein KJ601_08105 [Nanoarchaeota archaeon]|nr:hypothetical protein [Nanoarchaeota archaeon]MBU1704780.1 hypothetical protein [Nanoarchaeota archaeon]